MKRITVLLVDDHTIVREGFRKMLELEPDLEVAGEAQDGRQALAMAAKLRPDVVLMDIAMPTLNGLEATRRILKTVPGAKVLILSAHNDDAYVKSAAEAGAMGFLLKQDSACDVCRGIREVHNGKMFLSRSILDHLERLDRRPHGRRAGRPGKNHHKLTPRELEVLQLIAEGNANKQVATDLGISIKTVEKHRAHLMEKLDIHDTAGLTRYAISVGIIECSVQLTIKPDTQ
jgi:DNA-binding NarL/FixJ family response regulator